MLCQHNSIDFEQSCEFELTCLFQNTQIELRNRITKKLKLIKLENNFP